MLLFVIVRVCSKEQAELDQADMEDVEEVEEDETGEDSKGMCAHTLGVQTCCLTDACHTSSHRGVCGVT